MQSRCRNFPSAATGNGRPWRSHGTGIPSPLAPGADWTSPGVMRSSHSRAMAAASHLLAGDGDDVVTDVKPARVQAPGVTQP